MSEQFDEHHHNHEHHHHEGGGEHDHHHHHHQHSEEHHQHDDEHHQHHHDENNGGEAGAAHNDNGYVVVPPTPQSSVTSDENQVSSSSSSAAAAVENVLDILTSDKQEEISRMLADIGSTAESKLNSLGETIKAEADSSSSSASTAPKPPAAAEKSATSSSQKTSDGGSCCSNANFLCPYYVMAMDRLSKVEIPPRVKDLLLWKDLKLTGAVFGSSFVLLISLAWFSLLTVVSALFLTALTLVGSYRFYLALIFRIKGTYDNTFDKLSAQDVSLPKDKVQNLSRLLENDVNRALNKLKSIVLWDNITTSAIAFFGFYVVYSIGCWFNTITLLILALVSAFTLPKVYDVYKKPIDQAIEKGTSMIHQTVKQIMKKVPMFNKKKTQ